MEYCATLKGFFSEVIYSNFYDRDVECLMRIFYIIIAAIINF